MAAGHDMSFAETTVMLENLPIKDFVSPRKSRRFGRLTKMLYIAAMRALESTGVEDVASIPIINATCAGETGTSLGLLEQIHRTRGKIISPALVPNSVHNAPAGYLSIGIGNRAPSITISQGWLSSEAAVAAASDWMAVGISERLLVMSGDEADPEWEKRLRDQEASPLADCLENEAFQEGAVALVLGRSPSEPCLGSVTAVVERSSMSPGGVVGLLQKHGLMLGKNAEVRVRQGAMGDRLRPVLAEALNRPVESIVFDGRGKGTAQAYAFNLLASVVNDPHVDELLLVGSEVDELSFLHWIQGLRE
jgi:hypothetical protein